MAKVTIRLEPLGIELKAEKGTPLADLLNSYGIEFPCGGRGSCGRCLVRLSEGEIPLTPLHTLKLREMNLSGRWRLACQSRCESDLVLELDQRDPIILADEQVFEFQPRQGLGMVVDLGTTTIVVQLVDLETGQVLAAEHTLNPQSRFGSDLVTRLQAALEGQSVTLTTMIRATIGELVRSVALQQPRAPSQTVMVGNTVMQHLFCGYDVRPLSFYPFESPHLEMACFSADELGWETEAGSICFYPSIGSYVGSDILAGIFATGMHLSDGYTVLVDLGTNGEIVIGNRHRMVAASTAAGPAFEGARISRGMLATTGAISSVDLADGNLQCKVIGNTAAKGICGSGLIDAVAALLDCGRLGEFGEILSGKPTEEIAPGIQLTQRDIQEFLLAKAAVAAGIRIGMDRLGIVQEQVETVYLAGGFGYYMNPRNVVRVGMLDFPVESMHRSGNTALLGAKIFLFSDPRETVTVLDKLSVIQLESDPRFQDLFIEQMAFRVGWNRSAKQP